MFGGCKRAINEYEILEINIGRFFERSRFDDGCIGVVPQLGGTPSKLLTYIALTGFIMNVLGTFFGHLFAADQSELIRVSQTYQTPVPEAETKPPTP